MDIRTTSAGIPIASENQLSVIPAMSCGKASGTSGPRDRLRRNLMNMSERGSLNSHARTCHRYKANWNLFRETEIVPGIQAVAASDHTPEQLALAISSRGEQLLCVSDVVLHPIHLEQPEWCAGTDFSPQQVAATRRRLMKRAANEKALVLAFYFSFPGLGRVNQKEDTWRWQPIETSQ
jgi:glyoxylase-like metal-dependent hydrolase (beta-lactamase superfamily II)